MPRKRGRVKVERESGAALEQGRGVATIVVGAKLKVKVGLEHIHVSDSFVHS